MLPCRVVCFGNATKHWPSVWLLLHQLSFDKFENSEVLAKLPGTSKLFKWFRSHLRTKREILLFLLRNYPNTPVPPANNAFTQYLLPKGVFPYLVFPSKQQVYFAIINCILLSPSVRTLHSHNWRLAHPPLTVVGAGHIVSD
jgi:hypothetical protein